MSSILKTFKERGFLKQIVAEEELDKLLHTQKIVFYIGFDPTADSLHVGHFVQLMAMRHMQLAGHTPIILIGGGTGMVGDPSGRTDMRNLMTKEVVQANCNAFQRQIAKFLSFEGENAAKMINNADWLCTLNYVDFLREIGMHFSVNKMLTAECYKSRMEKGLSFLEFNYMLMQAFDFYMLYEREGCLLQLGGDDQWSNLLAGVDLIRRKKQKVAYAMTFQLLTTSDGKKMGKTANGAIWLDANKTSPYDFYQYWRNIDDNDVEKVFKLLTFLSLEEIVQLCAFRDERMNRAKEILAYEVTKLVHGEDIANQVQQQVRAAFSNDVTNMPQVMIAKEKNNILDILIETGQAKSKSEARRVVEGGGVTIDDAKITDIHTIIAQHEFVLHKGKKVHIKVKLE